jgi:hypothetical protein
LLVSESRGKTQFLRFFASSRVVAASLFDSPRRALEHARLDERLAPGRDAALEVRDGDALNLQRGVLALHGGAPTSAAHEHFGEIEIFGGDVVGVSPKIVRRARFRFFPSTLPALGAGASRVAQTTQRLELRERLGLTPRVHAERRGRGRAAERAREARLRVARGRAPRARGGRATRHRRWALMVLFHEIRSVNKKKLGQADRCPGAARTPPGDARSPFPGPERESAATPGDPRAAAPVDVRSRSLRAPKDVPETP